MDMIHQKLKYLTLEKHEINIFEFNRRKEVNLFEFFDHYLKKKKFALIYSLYKELFDYGTAFEKKINRYSRIFTKNKKKKTVNIIF